MLRQTSERKVAPTFHDEIFTRLRFPKQYQFCGPGNRQNVSSSLYLLIPPKIVWSRTLNQVRI
jgi:hypothetical protein